MKPCFRVPNRNLLLYNPICPDQVWYHREHCFREFRVIQLFNSYANIAIELQHGLCIDWDGSIIKHSSATPSIENGDALLGVFLGGKNKFQSNSDRIELS